MANDLTLEELRNEGFIPWVVERRLGSFVTTDFFLCGDVLGHWPNCDRRDRIVNGCGTDVQIHIDKYLKGYTVERMRKNKDTGRSEIVLKEFPPNPYLGTLLLKYDFYIYSFVLRKFKKEDGKRSTQDRYQCRKWRAILSPEGRISFTRELSKDDEG
jgi:hypothetical protein